MVNLAVLPGMVAQASSDGEMLDLWLSRYRPLGRESRTSTAYAGDARAFSAFAGSLRNVTVRDLQLFAASLTHLAPASAARRLSAIKSLIGFAHRVGYLPFDVGAPIRLPAIQDRLAERILTEAQVMDLLRATRVPRDAAMLRLLYYGGLRIAEACGLRWRDLTPRDHGGQVSILGKGGKTRNVVLPVEIYRRLVALRGNAAGADDPIFRSRRRGGALQVRQVHEIVKIAARRARLPRAVSAHWLRHSHCSHALDRDAPVHVVQQTLGHASLTTTTRYAHARPGESSGRYLMSA